KMVQLLWKTVCQLFKKLHIKLPYDPAILRIGMYPREMKTYLYTETCTRMFKATLFVIAKMCKQANRPTVDERMNKMWYSHTMEYYLAIKRNEVLTCAITWM
ncbi:LORF2 protein, partial [Crocuta crocuta]